MACLNMLKWQMQRDIEEHKQKANQRKGPRQDMNGPTDNENNTGTSGRLNSRADCSFEGQRGCKADRLGALQGDVQAWINHRHEIQCFSVYVGVGVG